jgi:glycosyltransferase involved in cell wall biosynthesis
MTMKKVLVLVLSNLKHDARVRRQIQAIKGNYKTTVICFGAEAAPDYEVVVIKPTNLTFFRKIVASIFLLLKFHTIAHKILHNYYGVINTLSDPKFDLIIANDVETLPLAFAFPGNPKIIFDAHEYAPRHFEDKKMWRIFFQDFNTWLCKKYIPKVDGMMTVGKGLALEYEKNFHVKPIVINNANNFFDVQPGLTFENKIRLVHHGIATPSRKLELMFDVMTLLDNRFTLDLMLLTPGFASKGTRQYLDELRQRAKHDARIKIIPPVKSNEVVNAIRQYDMGVFLLPPVNFNYENTLPNKLFDFIQARLAVAIGPTPEMAEIVNNYNLGIVSEKFTAKSLAEKLSEVTRSDLETFKKNANRAAADWNAEVNAKKINAMISKILS